jgi:hypothetical protein
MTPRTAANLFQSQHPSVHVIDMNGPKGVRSDIQNEGRAATYSYVSNQIC